MMTISIKSLLLLCILQCCSLSVFSANITVTWRGGYGCSLQFGEKSFPCVLGKNGAVKSEDKVEGDGKTPLGIYPLRRAFYRADKTMSRDCLGVAEYLNCEATLPSYIWVDAPEDPRYNEFSTLPSSAASYELLYRQDDLYDLMAVIGYNDQPAVPYKGSAIFFHVASASFGPTSGCVATDLASLQMVLAKASSDTYMHIVDGTVS